MTHCWFAPGDISCYGYPDIRNPCHQAGCQPGSRISTVAFPADNRKMCERKLEQNSRRCPQRSNPIWSSNGFLMAINQKKPPSCKTTPPLAHPRTPCPDEDSCPAGLSLSFPCSCLLWVRPRLRRNGKSQSRNLMKRRFAAKSSNTARTDGNQPSQ